MDNSRQFLVMYIKVGAEYETNHGNSEALRKGLYMPRGKKLYLCFHKLLSECGESHPPQPQLEVSETIIICKVRLVGKAEVMYMHGRFVVYPLS